MTWVSRKSAGHLINRAARALNRMGDRRLKALGLAAGQLPVLGALQDGSRLSQSSLARLACIEQPTMASTLARMERDGLIRREPDPDDGRSSLIRLTPEILAKMSALNDVLKQCGEEALAGFDESEKELLADLLLRIIANVERSEKREDGAEVEPGDAMAGRGG
jgi:MarR family transcriptional regulator, transcriptional regulator for hemolysin